MKRMVLTANVFKKFINNIWILDSVLSNIKSILIRYFAKILDTVRNGILKFYKMLVFFFLSTP